MISLIIPIYNTKIEHLQKCLHSIISQTYPDFEIVIVDDGSLFISSSEYELIMNLDKRIRIVRHVKNLGVSAARNTGLANSKGEYLAFIDGDDEIDSRFLNESILLATKYDADLIIGTMQYIFDDKIEKIYEDDKEYVFERDELKTLRKSHLGISPNDFPYSILGSSSAKLIKKELAIKCRFDEKLSIFEDQIFVRKLLLAANKAVYLHHIWYLYYQYTTSSFHNSEKTIGRKALRLNIEYLNANNNINLLEPDITIRNEMLNQSIREFLVAIDYWIVQNHFHKKERIRSKYISYLYKSVSMETVIEIFDKKYVSKYPIALLYLLKWKHFTVLYFLLLLFDYLRVV